MLIKILLGIIILLIIGSIGLLIWCNKQIKQATFKAGEEEKQYYERISKLREQELTEQERYRQKLEKLKQDSNDSYKKYCQSIQEKEDLLEGQLQLLQKNVDTKVTEYEKIEMVKADIRIKEGINELEHRACLEHQKLVDSLEEYMRQKQIEKERLDLELAELNKKRNATIQSYKLQEERQMNQDFYRIQLTEQEKEDIEVLKSIRPRINNKDAINKLIYEVIIKKPMSDMLTRVVGKETYSGIYKITHIPSEKCYIGKSTDVKKRLTDHVKGSLQISTIADQVVHHKMDELGLDNFTFEILEKVEKEKLPERERFYIENFQSCIWGYNQIL